MKWAYRSYPALFAVVPVFVTLAGNPGLFTAAEVLGVLVATLTSVAIVGAIAYAVFRSRWDSGRAADAAALATAAAVTLYYYYDPIPVGPTKHFVTQHLAIAVAAVLLVAGLLGVALRRGVHRRLPPLQSVARVLTVFSMVLLVWSGSASLYSTARSRVALFRSPLVRELARDVPSQPAGVPTGGAMHEAARAAPPDVFVILLDEYAAANVLQEHFGVDNRPFEDSLRALGFRIPTGLRSNYSVTIMSVTSLLNFAQIGPLADATGANLTDYTPARYLLEHNRTERFLRARGYRFVFLPSLDYGPTRGNSDADVTYDPYARFSLGRSIQRSEFIKHVLRKTLFARFVLPRLVDYPTIAAEHAALTLAGVPKFAGAAQPTFVFAHVMMPHIPFDEDAACRPGKLNASDSVRMAAELTCLNRETLATVRAILARSKRPPIIILQGDHGTQALHQFATPSAIPTVPQARERFQPFGAYYLPDGGAAAMPDSTSLVNVMRYVLDFYFGADLQPVPNTMYYSHWRHPYHLTEIAPDFHPVAVVSGKAAK